MNKYKNIGLYRTLMLLFLLSFVGLGVIVETTSSILRYPSLVLATSFAFLVGEGLLSKKSAFIHFVIWETVISLYFFWFMYGIIPVSTSLWNIFSTLALCLAVLGVSFIVLELKDEDDDEEEDVYYNKDRQVMSNMGGSQMKVNEPYLSSSFFNLFKKNYKEGYVLLEKYIPYIELKRLVFHIEKNKKTLSKESIPLYSKIFEVLIPAYVEASSIQVNSQTDVTKRAELKSEIKDEIDKELDFIENLEKEIKETLENEYNNTTFKYSVDEQIDIIKKTIK